MAEDAPLGGHRMVLALSEMAGQNHAELAAEYEQSVLVVPWHMLESARQHLWEGLVGRALAHEIEFRGVRDGAAEPSTIHPGLLRGSKPDFQADRLEASGVIYHAVGVFLVQGEQPDLIGATAAAFQPARPNASAAVGGAENSYDWDAFRRELVRALFEGGLPDRRAIRRHMNRWCAATWGKAPDESRVRQKLNELFHPDIPEKADPER